MIYTIPEEDKLISSCTLESKSTFNLDSNFDNNDNDNNGSSFIQMGNSNDSDSNSNSNSEQYIIFTDFTKKQELKWFSNNDENIMLEHVHDIDARFNLRYPKKNAIKLEPHSCTYIDLKVALEIPATTIVQLAFRNSLAKKKISIRERIIDTEYIRNIIAILQNDLEKTYIIEPNKKIAQAIFLPLVKIVQLIPVKNKKKLEITIKEIQSFRSMSRIDVPVNMAEEKIVDKREIIFIHQSISIPLYDQYMITIERKVKNQVQIFEAEATFCKLGEIRLVNLYIPAKNHSYIKIPIYNNTRNVIKIPKETTIEYLTTEIEDQLPNTIPDFPQLCGYVDITS
ncbi:hypothetical protein G9A89_015866 [Geosiphon pyriformis]|nr:hypothetical protein G9A89_015866 [Geosiphon pyriformis]